MKCAKSNNQNGKLLLGVLANVRYLSPRCNGVFRGWGWGAMPRWANPNVV